MQALAPTTFEPASPPPRRRISPLRALAALVLLTILGIVLGATSGAAAGFLAGPFDGPGSAGVLAWMGAVFGALLGAVLGPVLGFGLLRRVPLGRAIGVTSAATVVAGAASFPLFEMLAPLVGAGAAIMAAVVLSCYERYPAVARPRDDA